MSPRRCDRVTVPPPDDAATGWEELCRHALANTRRCLEILQAQLRLLASPDRQHRLRVTWPLTGTTAKT